MMLMDKEMKMVNGTMVYPVECWGWRQEKYDEGDKMNLNGMMMKENGRT
jgi:hypothetical protein